MRDPGTVDATTVVSHVAAVHTVEIDTEAVLLHLGENRIHHLNPTATLVWGGLDGTVTLAELAGELAVEVGASETQVLTDTVAVVRHLAEEHLVSW